ncbi:MAG: sarcosine oxidase subunit delta [Burkholderiales bacterium]
MLLLPCPHCGPRAEIEFVCGGELTERPADPSMLDPNAWAAFVFTRTNAKGVVRERWWHAHGCRNWFAVARDTSTNEIFALNESEERP